MKRKRSIYVPWHKEQSSHLPTAQEVLRRFQEKKLKPCQSEASVEFDGCWVTIRLDCETYGVDCRKCPVIPGWENLTMIRW